MIAGCSQKIVKVQNSFPNGGSTSCYALGDVTVVVWHRQDEPEIEHRIQFPGAGCASVPDNPARSSGEQLDVGAYDMVPLGVHEGKLVLEVPAYFSNTVVYDVATRSIVLDVEQRGMANTTLKGGVVTIEGIFMGECSDPHADTQAWRDACFAQFKGNKHTHDIGTLTHFTCSPDQGEEIQRMGGPAMFAATLRVDLNTMEGRVTSVTCAAGS